MADKHSKAERNRIARKARAKFNAMAKRSVPHRRTANVFKKRFVPGALPQATPPEIALVLPPELIPKEAE